VATGNYFLNNLGLCELNLLDDANKSKYKLMCICMIFSQKMHVRENINYPFKPLRGSLVVVITYAYAISAPHH
jgi:hypothetical protein